MNVKLQIESGYDKREVEVVNEISIGRSDASDVVLGDSGLSRKNTSFFIDEGEVFVADESSLNGTLVNGEKVTRPRLLRTGDVVTIGSETTIRVQIGDASRSIVSPAISASSAQTSSAVQTSQQPAQPGSSNRAQSGALPPKTSGPPIVLIAAGAMTVFILLLGAVALIAVSLAGGRNSNGGVSAPPPIQAGALIPVRVIDPLGGEDEDDLDDLMASWEVAEDELKADNVADIKGGGADEEKELNVTAAFLADRQKKAFEPRPGEAGIRPAGLSVPTELCGDGVIKQKAKLASMIVGSNPYRQPMDFAELAEKRLKGDLIEMPMATNSFYLDVGGSAQDKPFSSFSFKDGVAEIPPGSPKYEILNKLASNFAGQKYDLNNAADRKQMRMRLLRMFQKPAKPILKELADAYFGKFGRPLRVTSLTRSMDYQILLNASNPNSFKVRGEGSLPPHTSGCAFDLSRKHMPADEQNFVMQKLAEMERAGKLDALIEYGVNACFHVFIYFDGTPPKM
ncbi:MAG: FHA domain-containing protein [Pyrinomonadaceae bacterium]